MFEVNEFGDFHQVEELRGTWDNLLKKRENSNIFSTLEWLSIWWKHFGQGRQLRILSLKDRNGVKAIAPLMLSNYRFMWLGKITKIEFVGSPQSDYNNFILADKEQAYVKLLLDYLADGDENWDLLDLEDIPEPSASIGLIKKMLSQEFSGALLEGIGGTICPYIDLPCSPEAFSQRLSGNMRRNLRRRLRRLNKEYRVEFRSSRDFDSIENAMNAFYKLHQKRWEAKAMKGVFAEEKLRQFHNDVARCFADKGWLSLHILTADNTPIAAIYSFDYQKKRYEYLTGFDPDFSRYGVANLLRMHAINDCIEKGFAEYDLMRGDETYKADWKTGTRNNYEVRLVRKGIFPRIYMWAKTNNVTATITRKLGQSLSLQR